MGKFLKKTPISNLSLQNCGYLRKSIFIVVSIEIRTANRYNTKEGNDKP